MPVAVICRKIGISQSVYFNRKKKFGGLLPDEMQRLKLLEDENARLKILTSPTLGCERGRGEGHRFEYTRERKSSGESSQAPERSRTLVRGMCTDCALLIRKACGAPRLD
ncbi:transposase [Thioclava kandeliae]|uniref:transposase n=1 Tax=Thioclava TaxID=285107 RepID=UPI003D9F8379